MEQLCTVEQVEQAAKQSYYELERNQELGRDQEEADIEKFWRQRPDRMAVKQNIIFIEFKRTMDLRPSFQANAETRATRQHEWLAQTLAKVRARSDWKVQVIIFMGGTMGSVEVERFESNLKALDVKKKEWGHIRKLHARALVEAHDEVLRSTHTTKHFRAYYEAIYEALYTTKHFRAYYEALLRRSYEALILRSTLCLSRILRSTL